MEAVLSDYPFTSRDKRDKLCRYETTDERTHGNARYGGDGRQFQRVLEQGYPQSEPENVHKIHAIAEFRQLSYEPRVFWKAYACEHKERACREKHAVDRTEGPSYLYYGG